jgi:hypothetical protein
MEDYNRLVEPQWSEPVKELKEHDDEDHDPSVKYGISPVRDLDPDKKPSRYDVGDENDEDYGLPEWSNFLAGKYKLTE